MYYERENESETNAQITARHLLSGPRLPFTGAYFGSIAATLYFSIGVSKTPDDLLLPLPYRWRTLTQTCTIVAQHLLDLDCCHCTDSVPAMVPGQLLPTRINRSSLRHTLWCEQSGRVDEWLNTGLYTIHPRDSIYVHIDSCLCSMITPSGFSDRAPRTSMADYSDSHLASNDGCKIWPSSQVNPEMSYQVVCAQAIPHSDTRPSPVRRAHITTATTALINVSDNASEYQAWVMNILMSYRGVRLICRTLARCLIRILAVMCWLFKPPTKFGHFSMITSNIWLVPSMHSMIANVQ